MIRTVLILVFLLTTMGGCSREIDPGRVEKEGPVVKGLEMLRVEPQRLSGTEHFVGTIESLDRGILAAQIGGRVAELRVREGDRVRRGQILLILADNEAGARVAEAAAAVAREQSAVAAATATLDLAEKTHARYRQLFGNQAVTPQEMDRVSAELEARRQELAAARAAVDRAAAGQSAARMAQSWTRITAPFDGIVAGRPVETGTTVLPGTPLLVLDRLGAWRVKAYVPESSLGHFAVGDRLTVEIPARLARLTGTLSEITPAADRSSRSVAIKVDLGVVQGLVSGLFARVYSPTGEVSRLLVPSSAVIERGQLHGLYVVEEGRARFRLVRLGNILDNRVEILSGLKAGETIVVEGLERVKNGDRVEG